MKTRLMIDRKWINTTNIRLLPKGKHTFEACHPQKAEQPFLFADRPWESFSLNCGTMIYENGTYKLWYEAMDKDYKNDLDSRLCYAESCDGVKWEKPELGIIEYNGDKKNNIVFDSRLSEGKGICGSCVFIDPLSPSEARYRMIYGAGLMPYGNFKADHPCFIMSFAYSSDGIVWKYGFPGDKLFIHEPITSFGSDTQQVVFWDSTLCKYIGYFRMWEKGYARTIARSETSDLRQWKMAKTILSVDSNDPFGIDFYTSAACKYETQGDEAYLFLYSLFDYVNDTVNVCIATSRDSVQCFRNDRKPIIVNSDCYDKGQIYACPGLYKIGEKVVGAYLGTEYKHGEGYPDRISYKGNYRMMYFDQDRFQGLHTDDIFEFNISGIDFKGGLVDILLNAAVKDNGEIRGGLMRLDDYSYIEGFSPEECIPVIGDGVDLKLQWKSGYINTNIDAKIELRLFMKNSTIYSIRA